MSEIEYQKKIPLRLQCDVFVAGGGSAGVAAAVAASRQGVSVFLAENTGCFGGMGTAGLVPALFHFRSGDLFLSGGIGREIHDEMWARGGNGPDDIRDDAKGCIGVKPEVLKRVYDDMVTGSNINFSFFTRVIDVQMDGSRITHAICQGKSGLFAIEAKVFIDCTGDADLAHWSKAPCFKGDDEGDMMPGTLCSTWAQIDWPTVKEKNGYAAWFMQNIPKSRDYFRRYDPALPGMWRISDQIGGGNIGHLFGVDGTDEQSLTAAMLEGRKQMAEYEKWYKEVLKGFENMELVSTGSLPGIRETRRIDGQYTLTVQDYIDRAVFADEIGRFAYNCDVHAKDASREAHQAFVELMNAHACKAGESYGIPYRSLVPRNVSNLLCAGRCISAERPVLGSIRVMPGCYITGQAAGVAAAIAANSHCSSEEVAVTELQARLKALGAYLPNH